MKWTRLHTRCAIALTALTCAWLYFCMQGLASVLRHYNAMDSYWHNVPYLLLFAAPPVIIAWAVTLAVATGIARGKSRRLATSGRCGACGHDLAGAQTTVCPECGEAVKKSSGHG